MACTVKYDSNNNVESVAAPNGADSKLFDKLNSNIFIDNKNTAWGIQKNVYAGKVKDITKHTYDTKEPKLFYKGATTKPTENLESVLLDVNNSTLEMGFLDNNDNFIRVSSIQVRDDENTYQGFLVSQVRNGQLSADKVQVDGTYKFKGNGTFSTEARFNATKFNNDAVPFTEGVPLEIDFNGTFNFKPTKGLNIAKRGDTVEVIPDELLRETLQNNTYDNNAELVLRMLINEGRLFKKKAPKVQKQKKTKEQLENSLFSLLRRLGVSVTTLETYRENYKDYYTEDPSINALADIANKVIALAEGSISLDQLTEEVAHFMVDSYTDQNSIAAALGEVVNHPEYNRYAEQYRAKYSERTKDEVELEDMVRREILGKILAKKLKDNFSEENTTPKERTLFQKLIDMVNNFISRVSSRFKTSTRVELDRVLDDITNSLTEEELDAFDPTLLHASDRIYFQLADKESKAFRQTLLKFGSILQSNSRSNDSISIVSIVKQENLMTVQQQLLFSETLVGTIDGLIKDTKKRLADLNTEEEIDENIINNINTLGELEALIGDFKEGIQQSKEYIENDTSLKPGQKDSILNIIDSLNTRIQPFNGEIAELKAIYRKNSDKVTNREVEKYIEDSTVSEKEADSLRDSIKSVTKDITKFFSIFGFLSNSRVPQLKLLQNIFARVAAKTLNRTLEGTSEYISKIDQNRKFDTNLVQRGEDGQVTHYVHSPIKYWEKNSNLKKFKVDTIYEMLVKAGSNIKKEQVEKAVQNGDYEMLSDFTLEMQSKFTEDLDNYRKLDQEARYTDSQEKEEKLNRAGASETTRNFLKELSMTRASIRQKALVNGRIDYSLLTQNDKDILTRHQRRHERAKSAYTDTATLKYGVKEVKLKDLTVEERALLKDIVTDEFIANNGERTVVIQDLNVDNMTEEAKLAFELSKLNLINAQEFTNNDNAYGITEAMIEELDNLGDPRLRGAWLLDNGNLVFNDEYYSAEIQTLVEKIEDFIDGLEDPQQQAEKRRLLVEYQDVLERRRGLLKQYKLTGKPGQIDYENMTPIAKETIRELDQEASGLLKRFRLQDEIDFTGGRELETNFSEQFEQIVLAERLSRIELAEKHMSQRHRDDLSTMRKDLNEAFEQDERLLSRSTALFIQRLKEDGVLTKEALDAFKNEMRDDQMLIEMLTEQGQAEGLSGQELEDYVNTKALSEFVLERYALTKVASYFKSTTPKGFTEFKEEFEINKDNITDVFLNSSAKSAMMSRHPILQYLDYNPSYTWRNDSEDKSFLNPKYDTNGPNNQPNIDKYWNEEFTNTYGITKEQWIAAEHDINKVKATRNVAQFEALRDYVNLNRKTLENYGMENRVTPFQRVQVSHEGLEQWQNIIFEGNRKANFKDLITDAFQSKQDEMIYGTQVGEENLIDSGIRQIPMYYISHLDNPATVTQSTSGAALMAYQRSEQFKARHEAVHQVESVLTHIEGRKFKDLRGRKLKAGAESTVFQMAREASDHAIYGISENARLHVEILGTDVDVAELVNKITKKVAKLNLAYNPFVDLTSLTTGMLNNAVASVVSQDYSTKSGVKANRILISLMSKYLAESGKVDKNSELHKLVETFRLTAFEERIQGTRYGRGVRLLTKLDFAGAKLANMPVTPKIMLSVLVDTKLVTLDGTTKFMDFPNFVEAMRAKGETKSRKDLKREYEQQGKSLYDFMDFSEKNIKPNTAFYEAFSELSKEEADEIFQSMMSFTANKIKTLSARQDGVMSDEDKIAASRNFLGKLTTLHKGWLFLMLGERFKSKSFNTATGKYEEGHYRAVGRLALDMIKEFKNTKSLAKAYQAVKENEENTYATFSSMKRVGLETAVLFALYLLASAVLADDEDDDSPLTSLSKLIYMRTFAEFNSQNIMGLKGVLAETTKDPIVVKRQLGNAWDAAWGKDTTKNAKKLFLPTNRWTKMSDIKGYYDQWLFFNNDNIFGLNTKEK